MAQTQPGASCGTSRLAAVSNESDLGIPRMQTLGAHPAGVTSKVQPSIRYNDFSPCTLESWVFPELFRNLPKYVPIKDD